MSLLPAENVPARLRRLARQSPDSVAVRFVESGAVVDVIDRGGLGRDAGLLGAWLHGRLAADARVMLVMPSRDFVRAFLACLFGGLVAVPAPGPERGGRGRQRTAKVVPDSGCTLVLCAPHQLAELQECVRTEALDGVRVESLPTERASGGGEPPVEFPLNRETLAFLQYTSGSTGDPKGVMVSHGNILANTNAYGNALALSENDHFGGWLPLYHDMGLIAMLLAPLLWGMPTTFMGADEFIKRPVSWLRWVSAHGITVSAAPDFAYDLCVRAVKDEQLTGLDLSRWRFAINGSEPIHALAMSAFIERFSVVGFRRNAMAPSYGLAEATVYVSTKPLGTVPRLVDLGFLAENRGGRQSPPAGSPGLTAVSCGIPTDSHVRIVDPDSHAVLPAGDMGEIWLRGPSVATGYWQRAECTTATFGAVTADGDTGWLRTGDLGLVVDGELCITGRLKDMLIVHGRNLFPQDLEQEARAAHPGLVGLVGAVFGVAVPDERIVVTHEVSPRTDADELPWVAAPVKRAVTESFQVPVRNVLLLRRGVVARTTSGKIERGTMRAHFLEGRLRALYADLEPSVARLLEQPTLIGENR